MQRGDVRVMMLHGDERQSALGGPLFGPFGGEVAGVHIVDHGLGLDLEGAHEVVERLAEKVEAGEVFEIAEVLALIDEAAAGEGEDIFEMAADGEQRRSVQRQRDAERNEAARAANELRSAIDDGGDGVVAALKDFAVVHEEGVGDGAEAGAGFVVVDGDGLFAEVGGGHDEGLDARVGEEEMVQGRVGEKDAEPGDAGGDGGGDGAWIALADQHDGARGSGEEFFFCFGEVAECAGGLEIADHDGERLSVAVLALAEALDGGFVGGIDSEVEAADAFDGEDLAGGESSDGFD